MSDRETSIRTRLSLSIEGNWSKAQKKDILDSHDDIQAELHSLRHYAAVEKQKSIDRWRLMNLKQEHSFDEYYEIFQDVALYSDLPDQELILLFTNGLKGRTKLEVSLREPDTLKGLYKIAKELNANKNKMGIECHSCRKIGHYASECRSSNCAKSGKIRGTGKKTNKEQSTQKKIAGPFILNECINEIRLEDIIFSTGAQRSVLSENIARKHNIPFQKSNLTINCGYTDSEISGVTGPISIDLSGRVCKMSFLVIKQDIYDVLLGLDYFIENDMGINVSRKVLIFPNGEVQIPEKENKKDYAFLPAFTVNEN